MERAALTSRNKAHGLQLWCLQFFALICKRFHFTRRQLSVFILQVVVPLAFVAIMVSLISIFNRESSNNQPKLKLDLHDIYKASRSLVHSNNSISYAIYADLLKEDHVDIEKTDSIQQKITEIGKQEFGLYKYSYVVGAEFNATSNGLVLNAYSNIFATHSPGISTNFADNVKCQMVHPGVKIETYIHPYSTNDYFFGGTLINIIVSICISFYGPFMISACLLFIINERMSKSKHLQLMTGVHPFTFWLAHGLWDFLICMLISIIALVIISCATDISSFPSLMGKLSFPVFRCTILLTFIG